MHVERVIDVSGLLVRCVIGCAFGTIRLGVRVAAVMGGVGYVATHISRPGVIHQTGTLQRFLFGEYDGRRSARGEA